MPDADPEMVPDTFSISWLYDNFLMTFANGEAYTDESTIENWGVFFIGNRGVAAGESSGLCGPAGRRRTRFATRSPPPPPTAGGVTLGAGGPRSRRAPRPGGPVARRPGRRPRRCRTCRRSKLKVYVNPRGGVEEDYPLDVHTRNFLDCVKSRQKPNADMEIGYYSALPCLLALESMQTGQAAGLGRASAEEQSAVEALREHSASASA